MSSSPENVCVLQASSFFSPNTLGTTVTRYSGIPSTKSSVPLFAVIPLTVQSSNIGKTQFFLGLDLQKYALLLLRDTNTDTLLDLGDAQLWPAQNSNSFFKILNTNTSVLFFSPYHHFLFNSLSLLVTCSYYPTQTQRFQVLSKS